MKDVEAGVNAQLHSCLASIHSHSTSSRIEIPWHPADLGVIKINVDAACRAKESRAGLGVVGRNERGEIMVAVARRVEVYLEPLHAKTLALLEGLQIAVRCQIQKVQMELDSLDLINLLLQPSSPEDGNCIWVEDIRNMAHNFASVQFSHVRRGTNNVAKSATAASLSNGLRNNLSQVRFTNFSEWLANFARIKDLELLCNQPV